MRVQTDIGCLGIARRGARNILWAQILRKTMAAHTQNGNVCAFRQGDEHIASLMNEGNENNVNRPAPQKG